MGKLEDEIKGIIQDKIDDPDLAMEDIVDDIKNLFPLHATTEFIFDKPPGPHGQNFIDVERDGKSIVGGEWEPRKDGYWALVFRPAAVRMH